MLMRFSWNGRSAWAGAILAIALVGTCSAAWVGARVAVQVDGVDATGNPSAANGGQGIGKTYKDSSTGIIVQTAARFVKNEFGQSRIFSDRGLPVIDPTTVGNTTPTTVTATNDTQIVGRPWFGLLAGAFQIAVYNPVPPPPPTTAL